ncbi:hypothetical protein ACRQ5D_04525 [Mucilaginibacter sp. P25]|uniref:hypothetical protein n=1 Tax=unclassified Mucilaginibacter TaxID=2617802 RepID=UPI003D67E79E
MQKSKSPNQFNPKNPGSDEISEITIIITKISRLGCLLPLFGINVYQRKLNSYENKVIPGVTGGRVAAGRL